MKKLFLALPLLMTSIPALAEAPAGVRIELAAGYDILKARYDVPATAPKRNQNGFVYGVGLGYDFAFGTAFSVGADGEATFATTDTAGQGGEFSTGRDLYAGGRITASLTDRINVYAKAGYTNLRIRYESPTNTTRPALAGELDGVRGALGFQVVEENGTFYGIEGRYSDYRREVTRKQAMLVVGTRF
jgi:outer membrane immunogenic protein